MKKWVVVLGATLGGLVLLSFIVALVIHLILLSTARFNWLEGTVKPTPSQSQRHPGAD